MANSASYPLQNGKPAVACIVMWTAGRRHSAADWGDEFSDVSASRTADQPVLSANAAALSSGHASQTSCHSPSCTCEALLTTSHVGLMELKQNSRSDTVIFTRRPYLLLSDGLPLNWRAALSRYYTVVKVVL